MCLVDDQQIPDVMLKRSLDVGTLQKIDGSEVNPGRRPWADVGRDVCNRCAQPGRVNAFGYQPEQCFELRAPLLAKTGRYSDQNPRVTLAFDEIADDPSSLHGLAKPDFVRQDDAERAARH